MNEATLKQIKWFWPWQDEKEEAWLEKMSQNGWHLKSVKLPCVYSFEKGEPCQYSYRLDYINANKGKLQEYLQIFQDAGWEYLGEMSNWRYWRKLVATGEIPEIFTDRESKLMKYKRLLAYMGFFLAFLVFMGINMVLRRPWIEPDNPIWISAIYLIAIFLYAVIIPIYIVVVVQMLRRINQLKKKAL
jgi:Protein of unknown function (DUF2812)